MKMQKTKEEWRKTLTPEQYDVLRQKGTEPRGGKYFDFNEKGMYICAACGHELFSSDAKFELDKNDPNYGWPSFDQPSNRENVELVDDDRYGMHRTEVVCKNCGSHLGHLFNDGPRNKTGLRYCINSCALILRRPKSSAFVRNSFAHRYRSIAFVFRNSKNSPKSF